MNKSIKKILASLTAAGMIATCSSAFAVDFDTPIINLDGTPVQQEVVEPEAPAMEYNGATFNVQAVEHEGTLTVPLREVMEQLGYTVTWNDETQGIECTNEKWAMKLAIGDNRYFNDSISGTFGSKNELPAPYLYEDSVTYVPISMLTDVMFVSVYVGEENVVTIADLAKATFVSNVYGADGVVIMVNDPMRGEVMVRVSDETIINGVKGADLDILPEGMIMSIEYGPAMTMSIPPQTTALAIVYESVTGGGVTVQSVDKDENGTSLLVLDSIHGEVIVRITDETKIDGVDIDALKEGDTILVGYGPAMTMSIPPQTTAEYIKPLPADESAPEATEDDKTPIAVSFEGTITEVNAEENQIVIDENGTARALTVGESTKISHGMDKRIYGFDDLTVGTKIKGFRNPAETRSIPPISEAISIEILD